MVAIAYAVSMNKEQQDMMLMKNADDSEVVRQKTREAPESGRMVMNR